MVVVVMMMIQSTQPAQVMVVMAFHYVLRIQIKDCVTITVGWVPGRWGYVRTCCWVVTRLLKNPFQDCVPLFQNLSSSRLPLLPQCTSLRRYFIWKMCDDGVVNIGQNSPPQVRGKVMEKGGIVNGTYCSCTCPIRRRSLLLLFSLLSLLLLSLSLLFGSFLLQQL